MVEAMKQSVRLPVTISMNNDTNNTVCRIVDKFHGAVNILRKELMKEVGEHVEYIDIEARPYFSNKDIDVYIKTRVCHLSLVVNETEIEVMGCDKIYPLYLNNPSLELNIISALTNFINQTNYEKLHITSLFEELLQAI